MIEVEIGLDRYREGVTLTADEDGVETMIAALKFVPNHEETVRSVRFNTQGTPLQVCFVSKTAREKQEREAQEHREQEREQRSESAT